MRWMFFLLATACVGGTEVKVGTYNSDPNATILYPANGTEFNEGEVVDFEAKVSDSYDDPDQLQIFWSSDLEGELETGAIAGVDGSLYYSTANLDVGMHVVSLTVFDSEGASAQTNVQLEIIDLPEDPTISIVHPTAVEEGIEGESFEFVVEVSDARDEASLLVVDISSDTDGSICTTNPDAAGIASCQGALSIGQHLLVFTVTNTAGYDASATSYFNVVALADIDNDGDGFTENQGDCNDMDSSVNPTGAEVENGIDDNCDGSTDEGTNAFDDDGDGFTENQGDCNDGDVLISPSATEICGDNIDNNCNSIQNEENATNCITYYRDSDNDGYGDAYFSECWCEPGGSDGDFAVTNSSDCFDGNAQAHPYQTGFFNSHRGDGLFDYNCDSSEEKYLTSLGTCDSWGSNVGDCTLNTAGWDGFVPNCGSSNSYLVDNDSCSGGCTVFGVPFCCEVGGASYSTNTQTCR